jgi:ATP-dependent Lon protease
LRAWGQVAIAERYLVPLAMKTSGLTAADITLTRDGIEALIRHYCREAGVRNLQKHVDKIFRKVAVRKVRGEVPAGGVVVTADNLGEFVGKKVFTSDRMYDRTPVGVVMGLAWTSQGARRGRV